MRSNPLYTAIGPTRSNSDMRLEGDGRVGKIVADGESRPRTKDPTTPPSGWVGPEAGQAKPSRVEFGLGYTMVGPRPPDPASSDGAWCMLDRHGPPAPPGAPRRDRDTPPQPRFGPESPRRRSDAEAARSVGETRPPGPPTGSFRPGLLRPGGPAPAVRQPTARRR